jgi:hypothetical protein
MAISTSGASLIRDWLSRLSSTWRALRVQPAAGATGRRLSEAERALDGSLTGSPIPKREAITGSRDCNRVIPAAV